jgi:exopolysaccharide biosynthesis protein
VLPTVKTEGNFTTVFFPQAALFNKVLYFSYCNLVGFQLEDGRVYAHQNKWGSTTAKHINRFYDKKNVNHHVESEGAFKEIYRALFLKE